MNPLFRKLHSFSSNFELLNSHRTWLESKLEGFCLPFDKAPLNLAILLYGSSVAGTSLEDGDADFSLTFYTCSENSAEPFIICRNDQEKVLSSIFNFIRSRAKHDLKTQRIYRARIPVVQFCDSRRMDICLSSDGVKNSLLLRKYMESDSRLHLGAVVAKVWARASGIINPRGGFLSSYAITIMFIYFFLQKHRKPFIEENLMNARLRDMLQLCFDDKYSSVPELNAPLRQRWTDYSLIEEDVKHFFQFYSYEFDFDSGVIDVRHEDNIKTKDTWLDRLKGCTDSDRWNLLGHENFLIRDPYETHSLGRSVDFVNSEKIREAFRLASKALNPFSILQ